MLGIDGDFDEEHERCRLRTMQSPFMVLLFQSNITHLSSSSYTASKRADTVAELTAKEADKQDCARGEEAKRKDKSFTRAAQERTGDPKG